MNNALKKEFLITLFFILMSIVFEMITFLFLGFGTGPKYMLFNLAFWIGFSLFLIIFPNKIQIIICGLMLFLQGLIGSVNASLYYSNGDIFDLQTFNKLQVGITVTSFDVVNIPAVITFIVFWIIAITGFVCIERFIVVNDEDRINRKIVPLALIMAVSCPLGLSINQIAYATVRSSGYDFSNWQGKSLTNEITISDIENTSNIIYNEQYQYNNLNFRLSNLKTFGTFGFYVKNLKKIMEGAIENDSSYEVQKTLDYINSGKLANVNIGTSKGNNLITVLLESTAWYMIDPYLTPNLYALSHTSADDLITNDDLKFVSDNTLKLENFHSRNSTNVSEQYVLMGSFPHNNDGYYKLYSEEAKEMKFDFSLANVIKSDTTGDIKTGFYHPGMSTMHSRNYTIKSFGFDEVVLIEDMQEFSSHEYDDFYNFVKDSDFVDYYIDDAIDTEHRFYSHLTTITTHGSYLNKDERHTERMVPYTQELLNNWDKVMEYNKQKMPNYNFPEKDGSDFYVEYVNLKSATMDLDKAIGILFSKLKESDLLDNTTVCLFSDHYCYYNDIALQIMGYEHGNFTHSEIYKIPAFVYDVKMAKQLTNSYSDLTYLHNNTFCGPAELYPTLLDIMDIRYNTSYVLSCSIFDSDIQYTAQIASLNGMFDENFFSFNVFDIENSKVKDRIDYNNLKQRFYCNAVYTYAKIGYLNNFYTYNKQIFK